MSGRPADDGGSQEGQVVRCRDCGVEGVEHWYDPAPGLCPTCFSARMERVTIRLLELVDQAPAPRPMELSRLFGWLLEEGVRPAVAADQNSRMARSLHLPAPKEVLAAARPGWIRAAREAVRQAVRQAEREAHP